MKASHVAVTADVEIGVGAIAENEFRPASTAGGQGVDRHLGFVFCLEVDVLLSADHSGELMLRSKFSLRFLEFAAGTVVEHQAPAVAFIPGEQLRAIGDRFSIG